MYRTLMVPLDGSPEAERPLPYVAALADACVSPAKVVLVRSALAADGGFSESDPSHVRAMEEAESYLREMAMPLAKTGIDVTAVSGYGNAIDTILAQARAHEADLIAMSTHGRWAVDRLVHGSLAGEVMARADRPVLLFGPHAGVGDRFKRLLVAVDGGPFSAAVLPEVGRFARSFGASSVDLVAVLPSQTLHIDDLEGAPPAWALERLGLRPLGSNLYALNDRQPLVRDRLAELEHALEYWSDWLGDGPDVRVHARYDPSAHSLAANIVAASRELEVDLVVMRTHARRGLDRAVTGSVADEMVRSSPLPILLFTTEALEAVQSSAAATTVQIEVC